MHTPYVAVVPLRSHTSPGGVQGVPARCRLHCLLLLYHHLAGTTPIRVEVHHNLRAQECVRAGRTFVPSPLCVPRASGFLQPRLAGSHPLSSEGRLGLHVRPPLLLRLDNNHAHDAAAQEDVCGGQAESTLCSGQQNVRVDLHNRRPSLLRQEDCYLQALLLAGVNAAEGQEGAAFGCWSSARGRCKKPTRQYNLRALYGNCVVPRPTTTPFSTTSLELR